MVYKVATMVDLIGEGGYYPSSSSLWWPFQGKQERKQLEETELVMDGTCSLKGKCTKVGRENIPLVKVLKFVQANEKYLSKNDKGSPKQ
jgi:hypothetical protein